MFKIIKIMRCAHMYDSNLFNFYGKVRHSFCFLSSNSFFILSFYFLRNRSLFFFLSVWCKMVWNECKRNNRLLESACNNTKLPIDSISYGVKMYARNCVCRPLTISSPLNILDCKCVFLSYSIQVAAVVFQSIHKLISKTGKYTNTKWMKLTHISVVIYVNAKFNWMENVTVRETDNNNNN